MTNTELLPLAVTMGDPAGCGPQITCNAWRQLRSASETSFFVIGTPELYQPDVPIARISHPSEANTAFPDALPVLPLADVPSIQPGSPNAAAAPAIIAAIEHAVRFAQSGDVAGVVTNPINKALLYGAGFTHPGHTEFIAELCRTSDRAFRPVMMLMGGGLRVALATIHMPLKDVPAALDTDKLVELGTLVHTALVNDFALPDPKIAFTGLNPHAGENATIGTEERDIINPAAATLRTKGITMSDARPGDTVFAEALSGQFDAIIAMTHDQGLIPVKTLDMWGGVNITLGLPIVRTSPDHGTAYDAAATRSCRPDSLIAALHAAQTIANNRKTAS
ncbi:MAG: 4-hydroxythreonine-4-phosphate dehydrogenase PdxA [Hyphomonas sp.]